MKVARLTGGLGLIVLYTACGRSVEPSAPSASATSASSAAPAAAEEAKPETPAAAPAPVPPPAGPQGLDRPKSKAAADEAEFTSLEAAERALNQAKADLDRLALAEPAPSIGRDATADRAAEKKSGARAPNAAGAAAPTKSNAVCDDACRAFSSLTRAANAVCRLDGNSGTHCQHAKHVLSDAQQRVASCSCSGSD